MMDLFGHRGAQDEAPESTLTGFRYAMDIGVRAVEFDVQRTADRQLVVIHDATLDRTTDARGPVASRPLAELRAVDARAGFDDWLEPCGIPTLDEVLAVVGDLDHLLVEIKRDDPEQLDWVVPATIEAIHARGLMSKSMISSFDPYALEVAARTDPAIRRVINGAWRAPETPARAIAAGAWGTDFDFRQVGQEHIDWAREHDLWVIGWPCNSASDLARHEAFGVNAVGSDVPTMIQQLMD